MLGSYTNDDIDLYLLKCFLNNFKWKKRADFKVMSIIEFHFYFLKYKIYAHRYTRTTHRQTHTHRKMIVKFYTKIFTFLYFSKFGQFLQCITFVIREKSNFHFEKNKTTLLCKTVLLSGLPTPSSPPLWLLPWEHLLCLGVNKAGFSDWLSPLALTS